MPHTSHKGRPARFYCHPRNPFTEHPGAAVRETVGGRVAAADMRET